MVDEKGTGGTDYMPYLAKHARTTRVSARARTHLHSMRKLSVFVVRKGSCREDSCLSRFLPGLRKSLFWGQKGLLRRRVSLTFSAWVKRLSASWSERAAAREEFLSPFLPGLREGVDGWTCRRADVMLARKARASPLMVSSSRLMLPTLLVANKTVKSLLTGRRFGSCLISPHAFSTVA